MTQKSECMGQVHKMTKKYSPQMTIEKQVSKTTRRLSNIQTGPKNSAPLSFSARVIPFIRRQT